MTRNQQNMNLVRLSWPGEDTARILLVEPAGKQELELKSSFLPSFPFPWLMLYALLRKEKVVISSALDTGLFSCLFGWVIWFQHVSLLLLSSLFLSCWFYCFQVFSLTRSVQLYQRSLMAALLFHIFMQMYTFMFSCITKWRMLDNL